MALLPQHADTLRALVVLVQFAGDFSAGDPALAARGWPLTPDRSLLPDFARHLLAPSPHPPFADSTLTAYFHQQSQGQFVVYGETYPRVVVTQQPEEAYHRPEGDYGVLAREVFGQIQAAGFDFSGYDANRDGALDQIYLLIRNDTRREAKQFTWVGASCLDARCAFGSPRPARREALVLDGLRVDWDRSGSVLFHRTPGNILPQHYLVRMMAHELGHDLWTRFNHVEALRDNDVPAECSRGSVATACVGYVLMGGAGGSAFTGGAQTISAWEREQLGWARCEVLAEDRDGVRVGDLYTTGDCVSIPFRYHAARGVAARRLVVSNLQRVGIFDQRRRGGDRGQFDMGLLMTTGLLVGVSDDAAGGTRYEVIPADGDLALAADSSAYVGDLFGPSTQRQLTPWTRPSSSGTMVSSDLASWHALDRIRYAEDSVTMAFDFVADARTRPVFRAESWMAAESEGLYLSAPVRVEAGAVLHIESGVAMAGRVDVEAGGRVVVEPGGALTLGPRASLRLAAGASVEVRGTLRVEGFVLTSAGARWTVAPAGRVEWARL